MGTEKREVLNLLKRRVKQYKDIISDVDCLFCFYKDAFSLLEKKRQKIENRYKDGLFIARELDKLFSSDKQNITKSIDAINELVLPNGKLFKDIISVNSVEQETDGTVSVVIKYTINSTGDIASDPTYAKKAVLECESELRILHSSILENIIIIFEEFLASCYFMLIVDEPNRYLGDKSIKVSDLFDDGFSITNVFEKEVSSSMYDSLGCLKKISEKTKINVDRLEPILPFFVEMYYRRNLVVHNSSVVNSQYLSEIDERYIKVPKKGELLITNDEYIEKSFSYLIKLLTSLAYEVACVVKPIEEKWKDDIGAYGFQCLSDCRYGIAEYIYKILKSDKENDFLHRLMYMVNYLNAKKQQGKDIQKELEGLDVSATTDDYKIAKCCLENKHENVYRMLCETYPRSFTADSIRTWPIFLNFRDTSYYQDFVAAHKADFDVFEYTEDKNQGASPSNRNENCDPD